MAALRAAPARPRPRAVLQIRNQFLYYAVGVVTQRQGDRMTHACIGSRAVIGVSLQQDQKFSVLLARQSLDAIGVPSQHRFDICGRTVPAPDPHHLGCRTGQLTAFLEIRILGHYGESTLQRKTPDGLVGSTLKSNGADVPLLWKDFSERIDQAWREILVEKQLHGPTLSCARSRSAA